MLLFLYLIICLLMLQLKRESRELSVTLLYVQRYKTGKKKKLCKEIKALKQPRSEFQEQKLR